MISQDVYAQLLVHKQHCLNTPGEVSTLTMRAKCPPLVPHRQSVCSKACFPAISCMALGDHTASQPSWHFAPTRLDVSSVQPPTSNPEPPAP